jgi:endonuclease-3
MAAGGLASLAAAISLVHFVYVRPRHPLPNPPLSVRKLPFDIDRMMRLLRAAVRPYPKAALFELRDEGFGSAFEQLAACLISIRTRDEVTLPVARRLFARARTPAAVAALGWEGVDERIGACAFHQAKARQIVEIAAACVERHGGELPCDEAVMLGFRGVGPKCANLVLGIACGQPRIGVDVHVHRVTNRWGYVAAPTPEATMRTLEEVLPKKHWVTINELLVPFGKHVCTGRAPRCSGCPLLPYCRQVGVTEHR